MIAVNIVIDGIVAIIVINYGEMGVVRLAGRVLSLMLTHCIIHIK